MQNYLCETAASIAYAWGCKEILLNTEQKWNSITNNNVTIFRQNNS